jgi:hypothetical protein
VTDYQIWPATDGPPAAQVDGGVVLATEFYVTTSGLYVKALRFWRADTSITGTITGRVYVVIDAVSGSPLAGSDVTWVLSGTGWLTAALAAPVALTSGQRYRVSAQFPVNYSATPGYWTTGGAGATDLVNGPLIAPTTIHATGGDQGSYVVSGSLAYTLNSFGAASYWVDVTVTDTVAGPQIGTATAAAGATSSISSTATKTGGPV